MRSLWPEYLKRDTKIDCLVFVVDASDHARYVFAEEAGCCFCFFNLLSHLRIGAAAIELDGALKILGGNKPVLILGSKFDVHRAYSAYQLSEKMHLREKFSKETKKRLWCCQSFTSVTGRGITEGLEWITWACSTSHDNDECWYCRNQDIDEDQLVACARCTHNHCKSCITTGPNGATFCLICFYCLKVHK